MVSSITNFHSQDRLRDKANSSANCSGFEHNDELSANRVIAREVAREAGKQGFPFNRSSENHLSRRLAVGSLPCADEFSACPDETDLTENDGISGDFLTETRVTIVGPSLGADQQPARSCAFVPVRRWPIDPKFHQNEERHSVKCNAGRLGNHRAD